MTELVLNIGGLGVVLGHTAIHPHWCFQIIMTPFQSTTQAVTVRQGEDTLQVGHGATLVTLQFLVIGEVRIIRREVAIRVIAVGKGDRRIVIIVGMTVPVHVERHLVGLVQFPDAAKSQTLVTIHHIVGLHIDSRVFAAGPIDALPIGAALGIELQILQRFVGQTLGDLPVGVAIDGHIT